MVNFIVKIFNKSLVFFYLFFLLLPHSSCLQFNVDSKNNFSQKSGQDSLKVEVPFVSLQRCKLMNWTKEYLTDKFESFNKNSEAFYHELQSEFENTNFQYKPKSTLFAGTKSSQKSILRFQNQISAISTNYIRPDYMSKNRLKELLLLHNYARSKVQPFADEMMEITWDQDLEKKALKRSKTCQFKQFTSKNKWESYSSSKSNENLYVIWGIESEDLLSLEKVVDTWISNHIYFNIGKQDCSGGPCEDYIRIIWRQTDKMGCGWSKCDEINVLGIDVKNAILLSCYYTPSISSPPYVPYFNGKPCSFCPVTDQCFENLCVNFQRRNSSSFDLIKTSRQKPESTKTILGPAIFRILFILLVMVIFSGTVVFGTAQIFEKNNKSKLNFVGLMRNIRSDLVEIFRGGIIGMIQPGEPSTTWGWFIVFVSWMTLTPIMGVLSSFAILLKPISIDYEANFPKIIWIASFGYGCLLGTCPLSNYLYKRFGARITAFVGVFGAAVSLLVASFSPSQALLFIAYSLCYGISANFVYNSAFNVIVDHFPNLNQTKAIILATCSVPFGFVAINSSILNLADLFNWRIVLRILALIILIISTFLILVLRPILDNQKVDEEEVIGVIELKTESLPHVFIFWLISLFFWSLAYLFSFFFITELMKSQGFISFEIGNTFIIFGLFDSISRLVLCFTVDVLKINLIYILVLSSNTSAIISCLCPHFTTLGSFYLYASVCGLASGTTNALIMVTTVRTFGGKLRSRKLNYINIVLAFGFLIGPIIMAETFNKRESFTPSLYICAIFYGISAFMMSLIPFSVKAYSTFYGDVDDTTESSAIET